MPLEKRTHHEHSGAQEEEDRFQSHGTAFRGLQRLLNSATSNREKEVQHNPFLLSSPKGTDVSDMIRNF